VLIFSQSSEENACPWRNRISPTPLCELTSRTRISTLCRINQTWLSLSSKSKEIQKKKKIEACGLHHSPEFMQFFIKKC
jgi:hypothetical protein